MAINGAVTEQELTEHHDLRHMLDTLSDGFAELHQRIGENAELGAQQLCEGTAVTTTLVEALFDTAAVGLAYVDRDCRFLRVNTALALMNGATVAEHTGRNLSELIPDASYRLEDVWRDVLRTGKPVVNYEVVGDPSGGRRGHWLNSVYPVTVGDDVVGLICVVVDVSERRRAEEFRAVVTEAMLEGLYACDAEGRLTFVNAAAARMLGWSEKELRTRNVHETIHLQHADGMPLCDHETALSRVLAEQQPLNAVADTFTRRDGSTLPVTYSAAPLVHAEHGCGVVVVFRDATQERAEEQQYEHDLDSVHWLGLTRQALDEDRLVLYSQPVVPLAGGPPSEELLVRMRDREGNVIAPGLFLPAAEEYGLIREIDRWVIAQAAQIAAQGRRIEVNLSAKSVDVRLLAYIEHELRWAGADPANVVFELTETALMGDITVGETFANGLAKIGCGLALDDFGTGFASLTYLKILPVQYLKIDVEFVRDLATNETNQHLVRTIVSLARGLGQETVAEGVEDEETLALLREYGVDFAQGYHLGRPAPMTDPKA
jgi:PAS domain S-box-containing protein